jgi:hypothetical protein
MKEKQHFVGEQPIFFLCSFYLLFEHAPLCA